MRWPHVHVQAELRAERARASELAEALRVRTEELRAAMDDAAEGKNLAAKIRDRAERADQIETGLLSELEAKSKALLVAEGQVQAARELVVRGGGG